MEVNTNIYSLVSKLEFFSTFCNLQKSFLRQAAWHLFWIITFDPRFFLLSERLTWRKVKQMVITNYLYLSVKVEWYIKWLTFPIYSIYIETRKATGFKPLRVNYREINQRTSKFQIDFWTKLAKIRSKTEKVNTTIESCIFELVWVSNFSWNWQFWFFRLDLS